MCHTCFWLINSKLSRLEYSLVSVVSNPRVRIRACVYVHGGAIYVQHTRARARVHMTCVYNIITSTGNDAARGTSTAIRDRLRKFVFFPRVCVARMRFPPSRRSYF